MWTPEARPTSEIARDDTVARASGSPVRLESSRDRPDQALRARNAMQDLVCWTIFSSGDQDKPVKTLTRRVVEEFGMTALDARFAPPAAATAAVAITRR